MSKILLVEDDDDLIGRIVQWLGFEHHTVETVKDGDDALDRMRFYDYDIVILDWGLPKLSGLEVCRTYRSSGGKTPILMLTGKNEVLEKEAGLDSGADDYLTKPFHLKELSARIRAILRRPYTFTGTVLQVGKIRLDPANHRVTRDEMEVQLHPKEFSLLEFFMRHPNEVFSPEALLSRVWSSESEASVDTVYTTIKTLRRKISPEAPTSFISNIPKLGYRLESS